MTGLVFFAALASLPLVGYPFQRSARFAALPRAARWGLAGALGAIVLCAEMVLATWLGARWRIWLMLLPAAILALARGRTGVRPGSAAAGDGDDPSRLSLLSITAILGVVTYAAATARATAADFVLFWGTKGQRFGLTGSIDTAFLRDPLHELMHPDYPPMVACLYAWGTLLAGRFAWGAALLAMPLFLALTAACFYGFAQLALGRRLAAEYACLLTALLGFLLVSNAVAGDAEPELFFFETLALSALLFAGRTPAGLAAAAVGLAGAVLTKVEGTVFTALVATLYAAWLAPGRRLKAIAVLGLPAATALAGWILFCERHGLIGVYGAAGKGGVHSRWLTTIVRGIARDSLEGPLAAAWIVVALLLLARRPSRASLAVLSVAAGFVAFMVYLYSISPSDPSQWIRWSASRLSITPLLCCFFAAAASEPSVSIILSGVESAA